MQNAFKDFLSDSHIKRKWTRYYKTTYCIWNNALWIQFYKHDNYSPSFTTKYYNETLEAYKKLDYPILEKLWNKKAFTTRNKNYKKQLFEGVLERRDQVVKNAEKCKDEWI